jgi:FkbM family methyltransferase
VEADEVAITMEKEMELKTNIIAIKGAKWKHNFLMKLATSKEFPTRLRVFHTFRKLWGLELLKFTTPSGLKLLLDISDWVQSQIYFHGTYEAKSVGLFKKLAANTSVVFDIGSHIGQYALECAQDDKAMAKQIFAIEVNPKTFTYLLNNIQLNEFLNVKAVLGAVAATPDILNISIPAYWNMGNTQINEQDEMTGFDHYLAASFSITSLLKKYNLTHIDLVKIDVEGHEHDVLNSLFKENIYPANIIFEHIPEVFTQASVLMSLLKDNGYIITDIFGEEYTGQKEIAEYNLWAHKI